MAAASDDYYNLGTYRRSITTKSPDAETWFNRGLIWCYGFNHEEAAKCFERAIAADDGCAMAYWGVAYALGPNYNKPWDFFDDEELETTVQKTHRMVELASKYAAAAADNDVTPLEKALVDALRYRYPREHARPEEDCSIWNVQYADAMQRVHAEFGDDLDVAALCADALMNLTPWKLWDLKTGEPAQGGARTRQVQAILERALGQPQGMQHPGVLHLYIHFIEMSPTPEAGLAAADALRGLVPDAGHLNHMPTHIDVLVGDYERAMAWNRAAYEADEKYLARAGARNFYTLYRMHDYHFRLYAALFAGQSRVALDTVARLEASLLAGDGELLRVRSPPMADWLEGFLAMRVHALVRFGRWDDLVALPLPADADLYCTTTAMTHYAKAVALASLSRPAEAERERSLFHAARARVPTSRTLFNNRCVDLLDVAEAMMEGEVAFRQGGGRFDEAYAHLREAVARDDALPYDEPWGWMQPTRHAYGALLMERGHYAEAAAVYAADLGLDGGTLPRARCHPGNVWALHGYHECLEKLGRKEEAEAIEPKLRAALEKADVPIRSSCFCRRVEESLL